MSHEKIARLVALSDLAFAQAASVLQGLKARENDLRAEFDALEGTSTTPLDVADQLAQASNLRAHAVWKDEQKIRINQALALNRAEQAAARQDASLAFGRQQAAQALAHRAETQKR